MKKIIKILTISLLLIIIFAGIIMPSVSNATGMITYISGMQRYNNLLERNGIDLTCIPLTHLFNDGGPAYCLNLEKDGATETFTYQVNITGLVTDMEVWRTIVNGYPYKTPQELGCLNEKEAYLATRQAVYCAIYDRDPNTYNALGGEAGQRTLNALKNIVNTARTSTEVKPSSTINIKTLGTKWEIDELDKNYISRKFMGTAEATIEEFKIILSGDLIEGMKMVNSKNIETDKFNHEEVFKIMIPIKYLEKDGKIEMKAVGRVATKPVYFGASSNPELQNVAIAGDVYEEGGGTKTEYYFKNNTKIEILKQDQETKEPLQGVKFQLLDEQKKVVHAELVTDENGKILLENVFPGTYYIRETEAQEGYEVYEGDIKIQARLNENVLVKVDNLETNREEPIAEIIKTELEVEQIKTEIELKQEQTNYKKMVLPKTGM